MGVKLIRAVEVVVVLLLSVPSFRVPSSVSRLLITTSGLNLLVRKGVILFILLFVRLVTSSAYYRRIVRDFVARIGVFRFILGAPGVFDYILSY